MAAGGSDINVIADGPQKRMGGADGMVFVTGASTHQVDVMTRTLVRQLKKRDLGQVGVVGAMLGAEGNEKDGWRVVDCNNYIVHIQTSDMRRKLAIESMWTGKDRLLSVNFQDEEDVEDYVAANPTPDGWGEDAEDLGETFTHLKRWNLKHRSVVKSREQHKPLN